MIDPEEVFEDLQAWEDESSSMDSAAELIKSFIVWVIFVVLPSLVIAVAAWCFVYFVVTQKGDVSENDRLLWSNVWGGVVFIMAVIYFWKNK